MEDEEVMTGTTIIAFKYRDGVIVAADSRTSSGRYIDSRMTDKLTQITPNIFCCRSGSASSTQLIARHAERISKLYSIQEETRPSVYKTANLIKNIIYRNKQLLASIIVAGYSDEGEIYKIGVCGTITKENISLGGSGSAFIYGFCDSEYKEDMELQEAVDFAKKVVGLAMRRDNSSGGLIRVASITKDGVNRYVYTKAS